MPTTHPFPPTLSPPRGWSPAGGRRLPTILALALLGVLVAAGGVLYFWGRILRFDPLALSGAALDSAGEDAEDTDLPEEEPRDLDEVLEDGRLVAALPSNSTSYFLYRGQPMGFEYDLLKLFAETLSLKLQVERLPARRDRLSFLLEGKVDVMGGRLTPEMEMAAPLRWSSPLYETGPAVVQLAGGADPYPESVEDEVELPLPDLPAEVQLSARWVEDPADLVGQRVWIQRGSAYIPRLLEIADEQGDIQIIQVDPSVDAEQLIRLVAAGRVTLTISPENVAALSASTYQNVTVHPVIGPDHVVSLAFRDASLDLQATFNAWLAKNRAAVGELYKRYFVDRRGYQERASSDYLTARTRRLSPYDELFRRYAAEIGWDWRLLASQAYQESRFQPDARSWAGAQGLLQLMPATARELGVADPGDPDQNVRGAVKYLRWLDGLWEEDFPDPDERRPFILASYNVGLGHVHDARALARKYGDDADDWGEVAWWLLQKSKKQFYDDPVVKHGFCRGLEPVMYVAVIEERYAHYKQFVPLEL